MAYGTKFRYRFKSVHGTVYEVRLQEDGYSGSVIDRPLGKAPIIRMQDSDPIRATTCELSLECHVDGEYVDLYTLDPKQFKVEVRYDAGSSWPVVWSGFVATEIYSEPDIAPPYDVKITATDGIGVLKEYDFPASWGTAKSVREIIQAILAKTGLTLDLYSASRLREYGETASDFMDDALIDIGFLGGKSCYDVLVELLKSMRCILTRHDNYWLIVREVDVNITSAGALTALMSNKNGSSATYSTTINVGATVGQMGASGTDLWPVGYLTRSVVPAKNTITVRAPWNWKNGFPKVPANGWSTSGNASFVSNGGYYTLGDTVTLVGNLSASVSFFRFMTNFKVTVRASRVDTAVSAVHGIVQKSQVRILASWSDLASGNTYYYSPGVGWADSSSSGDWTEITVANPDHDVNAAQEVTLEIPSALMNATGLLSVTVNGQLVEIYDITVMPCSVAGYEDTIVINNGARGTGGELELIFGRATTSNIISVDFTSGIFYTVTSSGGLTTTHIITSFADTNGVDRDIMSLTAMARAKEVAAPRIEITGTLDKGGWLMMPPPLVKSHGVWALMSRFDWDMLNEDVNFTAVTLPTATLTVDSETITSIPE